MRASARIGWTILALSALCVPIRAQRYSFHMVTQAQGLTDLGINTVLQDQQGFIWIGGNNGLFRYDGSRVVRFGITSGLPAQAISALDETHDGTLWVATESGLTRREGDHFRIVDTGGALPERGPETIAEDRARGGLYIATSRGLLHIGSSGEREWVRDTRGAPVWSVYTDRGGTTWYAQTAKICAITPDSRCYGSDAGVPRDAWGGLAVDRSGAVWARSAEKLIVLAPGARTFRRRDAGLPYATGIGALGLDSSGQILVPTGIGLAIPNGGRWSIVGREEGLIVPTVSWAIGDREGSIWIAMRGGGVACWRGRGEWQNWTTLQGLKSDEVWAITRDRKQNLLVSTTLGVNILDHGRFRPLLHIGRALSRDRVLSMMVDDSDAIWIGAVPGGLFRYDQATRKLTHFTERDGIPAETIYSVAASGGTIWAGGLQGVYHGTRVGGRWVFQKEAIPSNRNAEYFYQILPDRQGRVWAAGSDGVACWRQGVWNRVPLSGVTGRQDGRLAEAPDGAIWLAGGNSSDLFRITGDAPHWQITPISVSRMFGSQVTYFLGFDHAGNLWRGTGFGVQAFIRQHWVRYTQADGLVWDDTDINAFYADADGSVWIGTTGGLSHHLSASAAPPAKPVRIVGVRIGDRTIDQPRSCTLTKKEGAVAIQFSVLTYRRHKDVRFRYRLSGFDRGWTETSETEARYSGLAPGRYTFEVESGVWNGAWSGRPAVLDVIVTGPWWTSRWFAAGTSGIVLLLIALSWRNREGEHHRREEELGEAVRQRTEELENERSRDRASNAILELIVSNQPLGSVLDAIGNLACAHAPGSDFCVLLRSGETEIVASARGVPWIRWPGIASAGMVPFEAWRTASLAGSSDDPLWRNLPDALGRRSPQFFTSRLIGGSSTPPGVLVIFSNEEIPALAGEYFAAAARLARIAVEHATMYDNLSRQARQDPLTGLPNRLQLEERLQTAILESRAAESKLALLYIDLDHFKEINDTLSHRAGDLYLQTIADRMKRAIRSADIVGRIGGDEFNVITPMISDRVAAAEIAGRILDEIRRPVMVEGRAIQGTASLGIAIYPDDAAEADELQRSADAAMYRAKTCGRDCVQSGSAPGEFPGVRMDYEVRAALEENRVRVAYQPKVSAAGRICGLEALVRIDHPAHGEISPSKFIPAAERSGLIVPLGAWVLNEVCRQIGDWRNRDLALVPVAVNVSTIQICRDDFAESVAATLAAHEIEPALIELELTESFLMDGGEAPIRQIEKLRQLGIRFSLDDFGAGYSSLSYLHRLNIDAIKLDRSFVQSIATDPGARRIVQGMIGVAEGMGLGVIGEGVETEEQRRLLMEAGCDVMQGYLFARPQPAAEIEWWLRPSHERADLDRLDQALALAGAPVS